MEKTRKSQLLLAAYITAGVGVLSAQTGPPMNELAPTGKLRVGIAVGVAPSPFWTTKDPATGKPRGVTVDLGTELARRLGVPLALVVYANSGEVTTAGPRGEWDVSFMPADAERTNVVDFGPPYCVVESTYLVSAGSPIEHISQVNRQGVRVAAVENTTTSRSAERALPNATLRYFRTVEAIVEQMKVGEVDAIALSRESLRGLARQLPGARILDGSFHTAGVAVAVPKNHPAALDYVTAFIEEVKASGLVRTALDAAGLKDAQVAPRQH